MAALKMSAGSNRVLQFLELNAPRAFAIDALADRLATNGAQVRVWITYLRQCSLVENTGSKTRAEYKYLCK